MNQKLFPPTFSHDTTTQRKKQKSIDYSTKMYNFAGK